MYYYRFIFKAKSDILYNMPEIHRRTVVKGLLATLAAPLIPDVHQAYLDASRIAPQVVIKTAQEQMREQIQQRRQIVLSAPNPTLNAEMFPLEGCNGYVTPSEKVVPWDLDRMRIVDALYDKLPPAFHQPAMHEPPVRHHLEMVLVGPVNGVKVEKPHVSQHQFRDKASGRHVIVLSTQRFSTDEEQRDRVEREITHESTHYVTSQRLDFYNRVIAAPLGILSIEDLRLVFDKALKTVMVEDEGECGSSTGVMVEKLVTKNHIGYGATNFSEFYSVAAPKYTQGRQAFVSAYRPYLGNEKTGLFYELVGQHLFSDKEFN